MKVRIAITLDVDADAWAQEYGTDPAHIRADVKNHVEQGVLAHLGELGMLAE